MGRARSSSLRSSGEFRLPRRPSLRSENRFIAVSYDKTTAAEPPIPLPARNPSRISRSSSRVPSASPSMASLHNPVVVRPPVLPLPLVAPPAEEHPALRKRPAPLESAAEDLDEGKRDSGHGHAPASPSSTILEEGDCPLFKVNMDPSPLPLQIRGSAAESRKDSGFVNPHQSKSTPDGLTEDSSHVIDEELSQCTTNRLESSTKNTTGRVHAPQPIGTIAAVVSDGVGAVGAVNSAAMGDQSPVNAPTATNIDDRRPTKDQPQFPAGSPQQNSNTSSLASPFLFLSSSPSTSSQRKLGKTFSFRSMSFVDRKSSVATTAATASSSTTSTETRPGQFHNATAGRRSEDAKEALTAAQPQSQTQPRPRQNSRPKSNTTATTLNTASGTSFSSSQVSLPAAEACTSALCFADHHHNHNNHQSPSSTPKRSSPSRFWSRTRSRSSASRPPRKTSHSKSGSSASDPFFSPLSIEISGDAFLDDDFMTDLSFSKRGSIMFGGQRSSATNGSAQRLNSDGCSSPQPASTLQDQLPSPSDELLVTAPQSRQQSVENLASDSVLAARDNLEENGDAYMLKPPPAIQVSAFNDLERESEKVRSLYAVGNALKWEDGAISSAGERLETTPEHRLAEEAVEAKDVVAARLAPGWATPRSGSSSSLIRSSQNRETELAGGLEDWDDLDGAEVDRYGFITIPRPGSSRLGTPTEPRSVQFALRRRNLLQKRDPAHSSPPVSGRRTPSRKVSARSLRTVNSEMSAVSLRSSRSVMRQASNLLPHNRERRWMDEAGDMLSASPSLQDTMEEARVEKISEALKRKEWERSEKWRKMAKVQKGTQGEGMEFEFDVKNPKLIERTWKGIPDRWRAAAWWSFMEVSARNHQGSPTEEVIITEFHRLQARSSPDDVQIDLDVPRTISRHIMFRRRYRGGQRLLFRVLHALSIYFPQTGYVQGMASLAATLLSYFDEEKAFVMSVRMWQLRGLDRLYRPGFEGLMTALHEFETLWINKDVAKNLKDLCVDATAYGTRWYLTLFNLSIPFPAQLRVWDVFLLLGDTAAEPERVSNTNTSNKTKENSESVENQIPTGLDILHAASAALVQALREVLLDSDFENAMRALTAFIPIKDEELLMKVAKAEWKSRQGKKSS